MRIVALVIVGLPVLSSISCSWNNPPSKLILGNWQGEGETLSFSTDGKLTVKFNGVPWSVTGTYNLDGTNLRVNIIREIEAKLKKSGGGRVAIPYWVMAGEGVVSVTHEQLAISRKGKPLLYNRMK